MITDNCQDFLDAFGRLQLRPAAAPRAAMIVIDPSFQVGDETAADNQYMNLDDRVDPERALAQQQALVRLLNRLGVPVITFDSPAGARDAVFSNNAFGAANGRFVIGAMKHPNRQLETRRTDIPELFAGFGYQTIDLSGQELVAELTGPLVIDRARNLGYCGMTGRVDDAGCAAMHTAFGLDLTFRFELNAGEYHTNVVLAVLAGRVCVVHPDAFVDPEVPRALANAYSGATLELSDEETRAFAGNCIAVTEQDVLMSAAARDVLRPTSHAFFKRHGFRLHFVDVGELEHAGGSVNCLITEIF